MSSLCMVQRYGSENRTLDRLLIVAAYAEVFQVLMIMITRSANTCIPGIISQAWAGLDSPCFGNWPAINSQPDGER